jgi:LmbE family N-acetylglucosaminyl deacetylase
MEDHTNTCRLAVTAAFSRGMPNFRTVPRRKPVDCDVTLYHGMPHGLQDPLRRAVIPELFVNTESVHDRKRQALAAHESQKAWLDATQGMDSYLQVLDEMSLELGRMSRRYKHAEGWRRHLHYGFSARDEDPLSAVLAGSVFKNPAYAS